MSVYYTPQQIGGKDGLFITADTYDKNRYLNLYVGTEIQEEGSSPYSPTFRYPDYYIGDDITEGGTDGVLVSMDPSEKNPLRTTLDSYNATRTTWKCALRCEPGYKTVGQTIIWFHNVADYHPELDPAWQFWGFCPSKTGSFYTPAYINQEITDVNTIVYIKVMTWGDEPRGFYPNIHIGIRANVIPTNL